MKTLDHTSTITVIGLGAMGLPMATNLAKKFGVRGVDINPERLRLAEEAGLQTYTSAPAACDGADAVLLAVRNQEQLEEALFGELGVVPALRPGAIVILTSTVGIDAIAAVTPGLDAAQVGLVDAPISGGPVRAGEGDLLVTAGAYAEVFAAARPVLDQMASTLVHVGAAPGKGQAFKTVNQLLCGVHIAAAAEALALAEHLDLDQAATLEALMGGAAASFMLGDRGPRMLQARDEGGAEVKSRLDIFVKDMGIVTQAARKAGFAVPVAAAAEQQYLAGLARGLAAQDDSAVITVVNPDTRQG